MDVEVGKCVYRLRCNDGSIIENPRIDGLEVEFLGRLGGVVEIEEGSIFRNTRISAGGAALITIKRTHSKGIKNTRIETACPCKFKQLFIDEGCSIEGSRFALVNDANLFVSIGKDCMMSSNILFRGADGHTIFNVATGEVLNRSTPIVVGDHVWIGAGATFLKGAQISSNVIVGSNTLLSRRFEEKFVAIAGMPARVVKTGVNWDRARIPEYELAMSRNLHHDNR
ncbi:acyltransferase [Paraburkholderia sp. 32]|uniref:acyltransferase n=1 Tax=Paraburkholderia sp. 32 TaxID=2991057 RepID=UPI003D207AA8